MKPMAGDERTDARLLGGGQRRMKVAEGERNKEGAENGSENEGRNLYVIFSILDLPTT